MFAATTVDLQLQISVHLAEKLYLRRCKSDGSLFYSDETNFAATKLPLSFAASKFAANSKQFIELDFNVLPMSVQNCLPFSHLRK